MRIKLLLLLLLSCSFYMAAAQTVPAGIDKLIKDAVNKTDTTKYILASRNDKYLNSLPIRTFTRDELISYLHNLNSTLTELLRNGYAIDISTIPVDLLYRSGSGIALWLNGELEKSPLVAVKGAELKPDNLTLLNNAGGILTSSGLGVNAIPILQYALDKLPQNNMILNNLGQAYLSLGDDKKAEEYLLKCVKSYEDYPDANLALALIYNKRGNKALAIKYAGNSLRGGWSEGAQNLLQKLKPDAKLMDYVRHRYKQPETFNFHKYPMLPQCRDVQQTPVLKPQYKAYKEMLKRVHDKYYALSIQETALSQKSMPDIVAVANKEKRNPFRPFGLFANQVLIDLWVNEYSDKFLRFAEYKKKYLAQRQKYSDEGLAGQQQISAKYKSQKDALAEADGEGNDGKALDALLKKMCAEKEIVRNRYLNLIADLNEAMQREAITLYKNYFNDMSFWYYVGSIDDHQYKAEFYGLVSDFMLVLIEINTTHFNVPCGENIEKDAGKKEDMIIEDPDCYLGPAKVKLPLGVVNLEISCDAYKLEAGEGLIGKIEYDRKKGETTIAFGVGGSLPAVFFGNKNLGVEFGAEAEAKSQFYITFDKGGHPTDLGIFWEAEMKLVAGIGEAKVEVGLEEEQLKVGFGTGVQMKEGGALKALIDKTYPVQPDDKQKNKNVPLYKKDL
ncbi:MAG: hypothetical protein ABIR30_10510 [Chitinophagaceae bacterium]